MSNISDLNSRIVSSIIVTMRNLGMVFAVSFAGLLLYTTISPDILQSSLLFNLNAYNFTTGMHRVVIMGAILSVLMALLSLTGFNSKKISYSNIKDKISIEVIAEKISK